MPFTRLSRLYYLSAVTLLLLTQVFPVQAQASGIRAAVNRAQQKSGKTVTFLLGAIGPAKINRVELVYGISSSCTASEQVARIDVYPGLQVNARYEWDLEKSGDYFAGMEIWWQWHIYDESGSELKTDRQYLVIVDPQYTWNTLQKDHITLYWSLGGLDFGKRLMDIASRSMARLADNAGLQSPEKIHLFIYPSVDAMVDALAGVPDWTGGIAYPDYNLVIIGISPNDPYQWPARVISHEIAHLVTKMGYTNCENRRLPLWLEEGLAEFAEGKMSTGESDLLLDALDKDQLPALQTLTRVFPVDAEDAELAYAHSRAVVEFLLKNQGSEKMDALLTQLRDGQAADVAMRPIFGFDTNGLDQTWRASEGFGEAPELIFVTLTPSPTITRTSPPALHTATPAPSVSPTITPLPPTPAPSATLLPTTGNGLAGLGWPFILLFPAALLAVLVSGVGVLLVRRLRTRSEQ